MVKKKYYLHTINNTPAGFDGKQICFAGGRWKAPLCKDLNQIRKEQRQTNKFRKSLGYYSSDEEYNYVVVEI